MAEEESDVRRGGSTVLGIYVGGGVAVYNSSRHSSAFGGFIDDTPAGVDVYLGPQFCLIIRELLTEKIGEAARIMAEGEAGSRG